MEQGENLPSEQKDLPKLLIKSAMAALPPVYQQGLQQRDEDKCKKICVVFVQMAEAFLPLVCQVLHPPFSRDSFLVTGLI